jgi:putative glutamine amidotransferase
MRAQLQQTQRGWSSTPGGLPPIAVSTSEVRRSQTMLAIPQREPPQPEMALGLRYLHAIEVAGGLPVVVPPIDIRCIEPLLSRVAGGSLSGGPDLDLRATASDGTR